MSDHSKYPEEAGIYKLTCNNNGKIYIGKSININKRLKSHKYSENYKTTHYFQKAIKKHGWDSFSIEILEIFEKFDKLKDNESLLEREAYYIKIFDSLNPDKGYNTCHYSRDRTGIPLTDEHKEKIRQGLLNHTRSEEHKNNVRLARLGIPRSDETKKKIRVAQLGKTLSKEHVENIKRSKLGKPLSEQHKLNMRKANLGKILSEDHKEKIRQSLLGKTHSEETKEKMRQTKLRNSRERHQTEQDETIRNETQVSYLESIKNKRT